MALVTGASAADSAAGRKRRAPGGLAAFLGHPWIRRARAGVRDTWWDVRGIAVRNPRLPKAPRRLLFVCKGNICRSPFAARVAAGRLQRAGMTQVECLSAGFRVTRETQSPTPAREASRQFGVSLDEHTSTQLDGELMRAADMVIVMEAAHMALLRWLYPGSATGSSCCRCLPRRRNERADTCAIPSWTRTESLRRSSRRATCESRRPWTAC